MSESAGNSTAKSATNSTTRSDERFASLVRDNFDDLWRYAWYRSGSEVDAEDLVANVFAVAWRRRDQMPEPPATRLWLFGVAKRALSDQRRSARRQQNLQAKLRSVRTKQHYEMTEYSDELWVALQKLDVEQREILLLRAWDGLAVSEMASLYECTPNAMSLRLRKARSALAANMSQESQNDLARTGHVPVDGEPLRKRHG